MYIRVNIGGVKSILVKQIPDYCQKQGILKYIRIILNLLWYKIVLVTSSVFFPFFSYILFHFNFMYIRVNIGSVKSILVKQIPDYRQKQGILIYIRMVPKLLWYKLVLATSSVFFPFFHIYFISFQFHVYIGPYWRCEVNFGQKNTRLPPKARYSYIHKDGTKATVI